MRRLGPTLAALLLPLAAAAKPPAAKPSLETAVFAGGCFWCMTPPFEKLAGVAKVVSGYVDGSGDSPTYEDYAERGFVEAVQVTFDPAKVSYGRLLDVYWRQVDPTDSGGQFCDRGPQYRPVIYWATNEQKSAAEESEAALAASGRFKGPVSVELRPAPRFWPAEGYHQDYWKKNPVRYHYYRWGCGRDQYLDKVWGEGKH
ncbi:MAG: peptide-methionine (S)-S-oxide reductase MsrA [Elusimicrobia bacterium]|nr:peptide-methionine (S)-S-oxide reductase MsrA [Elusimicrobiota bacterium]